MNQASRQRHSGDDAGTQTQDPLWRLIPLREFTPPANPAPEMVRSGLHGLWRRLRGTGPYTDGEENRVEMERPSQTLLDWAAPPPDWEVEETTGLDNDLRAWLDQERPEANVQTVVDAPIPLLRERLVRWATQVDCRILQPPTPEQIVGVDTDWIDGLSLESGGPLVLPSLERCFLRHYNGLELLRRLLDHIDRWQPALLVMCNSWAWRYLCQVEQAEGILGKPLTLAPFDDEKLNRWLSRSARNASPFPLIFREAISGKAVMDTGTPEQMAEPSASTFLKNLAARSRGNPRVAWDIWQRSLLAAKDSTVDEEAQKVATADEGYTLWVRPWDQVQLPDLTGGATHLDGMILYSLLQHGGLAKNKIADLLPVAPNQVVYALHQLREGGFVQQAGDEWQPTPIGYPAVRRFLAEEGFLVDNL